MLLYHSTSSSSRVGVLVERFSRHRLGTFLWRSNFNNTTCTSNNNNANIRNAAFLSTRFQSSKSSSSNSRIGASMDQTKSIQYNTSTNDLVVAILGPPNAGKSTLFNRLMCKEANRSYRLSSDKQRRRGRGRGGRHHNKKNNKDKKQKIAKGRVGVQRSTQSAYSGGAAIVSSTPGTTRDRRECVGRIFGITFRLVDTAGVDGERIGWLKQQRLRSSQNSSSNNWKQQQPNAAALSRKSIVQVERAMMQQTLEAAQKSDLVFLMVDARLGVTVDLQETARWLRKVFQGRVVILANKLEGDRWVDDGIDYDDDDHGGNVENEYYSHAVDKKKRTKTTSSLSPVMEHLEEIARMGFGEAIPISAQHGEGMADIAVIIDQMTREKKAALEEQQQQQQRQQQGEEEGQSSVSDNNKQGAKKKEKPLQLAILGRQNVGKSTLVNSLLGQDRVISGPMPGLTRDSISVNWSWRGRPVQLADTAGIRKITQRNFDNPIEDLAVQDAVRTMKVADVAVLVLDAEAQVLQRQELAIADAVVKEGRSLVVAANKMDLLQEVVSQDEYAEAVRKQIEARLPMLRRTPVVAMSSLTGEGVQELMPVVFRARDRWERTISTGLLNRWLADVLFQKPPPYYQGRPSRIKYIIQSKGRPPTFLLFCNVPEMPVSYMRYLRNHFQDSFQMYGMEVRMSIKHSSSTNPMAKNAASSNRSGFGLGGKEARKKRMIQALKTNKGPVKRRRRKRYKRH